MKQPKSIPQVTVELAKDVLNAFLMELSSRKSLYYVKVITLLKTFNRGFRIADNQLLKRSTAMLATIRKIGNSEGTIIPAGLLRKLNLATGDKINIEELDGKIVISASKPKYKLADLIVKCELSEPAPKELEQWDKVHPAGNEEW